MLYSEFVQKAGFSVSAEYYHNVIEPEYMHSTLDKDEFCKKWKKEGGIQKAYDFLHEQFKSLAERAANHGNVIECLQGEIDTNKKQFEEVKQRLFDANQKIEQMEHGRRCLVEFMIDRSEAMSDAELRLRCINMIGPKEYIRYKLQKGYSLWELDKELIMNNMQ